MKLWMATVAARFCARILRHRRVHLIRPGPDDRFDYFGPGRVLGSRVDFDRLGRIAGISLLWVSVGTTRPDYHHFPIRCLRRDRVLGLVIEAPW